MLRNVGRGGLGSQCHCVSPGEQCTGVGWAALQIKSWTVEA